MPLAGGKHLTSYSTPNKGSQNSVGVSIVMIHRMFPWNVQRYQQWMKGGNFWHNIASVLTVHVAVMKPQIATADLHAVHANADIIHTNLWPNRATARISTNHLRKGRWHFSSREFESKCCWVSWVNQHWCGKLLHLSESDWPSED